MIKNDCNFRVIARSGIQATAIKQFINLAIN